jgi:hypothetical protein|tara:strand:+ start:150 stop:518 length:369 start_codon:yes stop_codon:yes gene_type:complete
MEKLMRKIVEEALKIDALYRTFRVVEEQLSFLRDTKSPIYKNRENPWTYYGDNVLIVEDLENMILPNFTDAFIIQRAKETLEDYNEEGHSRNNSGSDNPKERREWKAQVGKIDAFVKKWSSQ